YKRSRRLPSGDSVLLLSIVTCSVNWAPTCPLLSYTAPAMSTTACFFCASAVSEKSRRSVGTCIDVERIGPFYGELRQLNASETGRAREGKSDLIDSANAAAGVVGALGFFCSSFSFWPFLLFSAVGSRSKKPRRIRTVSSGLPTTLTSILRKRPICD